METTNSHYSELDDSDRNGRNGGRSRYKCGGLSCRNIGGIIVVFLGIICTIAALSVDEMTAYLNKDDNDKIWKYCGWKEWRCVDTYESCSSDSETIKYSSKCNDCDTSCQAFYGYNEKNFCKTEGSGELWFMCSLFAMILLLISVFMDLLKIKFDRWDTHCCDGHYNLINGMMRIISGILYIVGVAAWILDNSVCWDNELLDEREIDLGQSPYWTLAACVMSIFSCPLAIN